MENPDKTFRWYAVFVRGMYEKNARRYVESRNIVSYLPLERKLHYWSDRKKWIETPLFPNYLFVHVDNQKYYQVLQHSSILKYVCSGGRPVPIPEYQINAIKSVLTSGLEHFVSNNLFNRGDMIRIQDGPLKSQEGEVVSYSGKRRLLIRLDQIGYSLLVNHSARSIVHVNVNS
ncbi:UpxY family transcription antiterminator [Bacteroidota bacterium]